VPAPGEEEPAPPEGPRRPRTNHWWYGFRAPLSEEERRRAEEDPGPSWSEYFYWQLLKWWVGLAFLVIDSMLLLTFLRPLELPLLVGSLVAAIYVEYVVWQYLWHRPPLDPAERRAQGPFVRSPLRIVPYGRWTPEARMARSGIDPMGPHGPDPREFL
jgi:hypothetical protein